ncbi:MAG: UTP--glucose-1-phosphate uridylyltransferase GalU [Candidatus Tectomicrobia bacterium]|uniref:UTP--glucose-1-phosphate uridylyltransferase n=1 Tax=Tectimicrobiota bacterium TaxID=2528274 RepID=A0A933LQ56_UNCTE|nr:UTP--glucose-1-phosphate uridylyltransferase GalU [Candidatus Tectomicrobia bacterium]
MTIRKAVFPAAGLGTRFLPATKASPKEMLPLVDKPLIQYGVEEAINSGIEEIVIITGRGKRSIEDHFDYSYELETALKNKRQYKLLEDMRSISNMVDFCYVRQKEPLGLGHAILCAKNIINSEPFGVLLGDDIIDSDTPCLQQLIDIFNRYGGTVLAIQRVQKHEVSRYGIIKAEEIGKGVYRVLDLIEKPKQKEAPSDLAIIGRYILVPEIFLTLRETPPDLNGEIQITDAIKKLLPKQEVFAYEFEGKRFDAGNKLGFLMATVELALKRCDLGQEFRNYLRSLKY